VSTQKSEARKVRPRAPLFSSVAFATVAVASTLFAGPVIAGKIDPNNLSVSASQATSRLPNKYYANRERSFRRSTPCDDVTAK
jgi:hypothetical protein